MAGNRTRISHEFIRIKTDPTGFFNYRLIRHIYKLTATYGPLLDRPNIIGLLEAEGNGHLKGSKNIPSPLK
jgi:hypothetical protein